MGDSTLKEALRLREENTRLKSLLIAHGIPWEEESPYNIIREKSPPQSPGNDGKIRTLSEKVVLFRRLFHGRNDVYAIRWESVKGKSGYAPACGNEWKPGVCLKPNIKCAECDQRLLLPLIDQVIFDHLVGKRTVGIYPLLSDDTCWFLATGSLIGEGFDHPSLDTLVLAMPVSWKGTLQQYAGRLHREYAGKRDVRIYDYVEHNHPQLNRMWNKRLRGYRGMGYEVKMI